MQLQATRITAFILLLLPGLSTAASSNSPDQGIDNGPLPIDLNGSNFTYPYPVKLYRFTSQGQPLEMAFMDVPPSINTTNTPPKTKVAVLLHGKNFCSATWGETMKALSAAGYRVIAPDQVGFCKSSKPSGYQFSLQQLALNTHNLLDALGITTAADPVTSHVYIIGHSMGGMLAARYALMYSSSITALALVNPIGLEDWKAKGVPYQSIDASLVAERASDYASIRAYEQATYYDGNWSDAYDLWVNMLVNIYRGSEAEAFAANQARIVDMVLTEPVVYEFGLLKPRTLLLIGIKDTTAIGKQWSPPEVQATLGHYDALGDEAAAVIPRCTLLKLLDLGHAPQIQDPARFQSVLLKWLRSE
jgi:pimeloyl-ACP methyl ester carboxylesterase